MDSRGVTWRQNKKGRWELLCRVCLVNKADYYDASKSTYQEGIGWTDEWHICKQCLRKERHKETEQLRQELKYLKETRWKEYCDYMDDLMVCVD